MIFKVWIKTVGMLFGSTTQDHLAYLNFESFEFLGQFTIRYINWCVDNLEVEHITC